MQTANIILALGGDPKNTIPKYDVTAAEIAVLQAIHGEQAVTDVEPLEDVARSNRAELLRLKAIYSGAKDNNHQAIVEVMFPGVAARVHENLDELNLDESQMKAVTRVSTAAKPSKAKAKVEEAADEEEPDELPSDDEVDDESGFADDIDYTRVTVKDLKAKLDEADIEYPLNAKKDDLIALVIELDRTRIEAENNSVLD